MHERRDARGRLDAERVVGLREEEVERQRADQRERRARARGRRSRRRAAAAAARARSSRCRGGRAAARAPRSRRAAGRARPRRPARRATPPPRPARGGGGGCTATRRARELIAIASALSARLRLRTLTRVGCRGSRASGPRTWLRTSCSTRAGCEPAGPRHALHLDQRALQRDVRVEARGRGGHEVDRHLGGGHAVLLRDGCEALLHRSSRARRCWGRGSSRPSRWRHSRRPRRGRGTTGRPSSPGRAARSRRRGRRRARASRWPGCENPAWPMPQTTSGKATPQMIVKRRQGEQRANDVAEHGGHCDHAPRAVMRMSMSLMPMNGTMIPPSP